MNLAEAAAFPTVLRLFLASTTFAKSKIAIHKLVVNYDNPCRVRSILHTSQITVVVAACRGIKGVVSTFWFK